MKRVFCLVLVLALMMTMSVPCLATENEKEQLQTRTTTSRLVSDSLKNYYTVMGNASVTGAYGSVITSFSIYAYAGGDTDSIAKVEPSASTDATVVFYGITSENPTKLDTSEGFDKGTASGQVNAQHTFTAFISMLTCTHRFWTNSGADGSVSTTTYPSDYT